MMTVSLDSILNSPRLPSLPAVAVKVLELTAEPEVDLGAVADAIRNDQALATKVLKTINSPYYGLSKPCGTIRQALVYLGLSTVKSIVLGFSLAECLDGGDESSIGFNYISYWRRGLYSAAAATALATKTNACPSEEAFLGALVQDLGMVVLYRALGDQYLQVIDLARGDHARLSEVELRSLEIDHTQVGAAIAERWRLPKAFVSSVRHHHDDSEAPEAHQSLLRIIVLGNLAARMVVEEEPAETLLQLRSAAEEWFSLPPAEIQEMLEGLQSATNELASLLSVGIGEQQDVMNLLATAEDRLTEHQVKLQIEHDALKDSCSKMQQELNTDEQTGLFNRRHFEELLDREFVSTVTGNGTLALIFANIDRMKLMNANYGREAADRAVVQLAEILQNHMDHEGWLARLESDTFALLLPGVDRLAAAAAAEDLRATVEQHALAVTDANGLAEDLRVTMSVGVAVLDPQSASSIMDTAAYIRVADHALYAAKASGRNCVRVFTPTAKRNSAA